MQAIILNSGLGSRMEEITKEIPKCMVEISEELTLVENQINILLKNGVEDIIISTGYLEDILKDFLKNKYPNLKIRYVLNDKYDKTNYIYSLYLLRDLIISDTLLMHGDLYFTNKVLEEVLKIKNSTVIIDKSLEIPKKDFKAMIENDFVKKISVEDMNGSIFALQPLYFLKYKDWKIWENEIINFINEKKCSVYAEEALNNVLAEIKLTYTDLNGELCMEVDNKQDLNKVKRLI